MKNQKERKWKKMNSSGDAAESIVRMSLQGTEVALRITGAATKNVIAALYALSQDKQKVKGRTKLENMLKSGKELKVFSVKEEDLKKFTEESKRYGVLFCALVDKKHGSLDRIDVNGPYSPENCRWATWKEQNRNRRNNARILWHGETHTLKEWSEILGLSYGMLVMRHSKYKWSGDRLFLPNQKKYFRRRKFINFMRLRRSIRNC